MSKHERNRAEKRDRMVKAGLDAFSETGYENTTVSDIVRRAGMTPSTFYNYFRDKDALLVEILGQQGSRLTAGLASIRDGDPDLGAYLRAACRALVCGLAADKSLRTLLRRNLPLVRSSVDHRVLAPLYEALREDLTRLLEAEGATSIEIEYAVVSLRATCLEMCIALIERSGEVADAEQASDFAASLLAGGFREVASS